MKSLIVPPEKRVLRALHPTLYQTSLLQNPRTMLRRSLAHLRVLLVAREAPQLHPTVPTWKKLSVLATLKLLHLSAPKTPVTYQTLPSHKTLAMVLSSCLILLTPVVVSMFHSLTPTTLILKISKTPLREALRVSLHQRDLDWHGRAEGRWEMNRSEASPHSTLHVKNKFLEGKFTELAR